MNELEKLENAKLRETAGSETFDRYLYQYSCALYMLLEGRKKYDDVAIIMEYIEDVVIVKNYYNSNPSYNFYQIKTNNKLSKSDVTKNSTKSQSVLHKLLHSSNTCKELSITPESIELVSAKGFKFCNGRTKFNDLKTNIKKYFTEKIHNIDGYENFLKSFYFTKSPVPYDQYQKLLSGQFNDYIEKIYPNSSTNISTIKRAIINELENKGKHIYSKTIEGNIIEQKGITLKKVNETIENYIFDSEVNKIKKSAIKLINDQCNYSIGEKTKYINQLDRYKTKHIESNTIEFRLSKIILDSEVLNKMTEYRKTEILSQEIDNILPIISERFQSEFNTDFKEMIIAGIFYELAAILHH